MKKFTPFLARVRTFHFEDDALLLLVDHSTIDWLMSRFGDLAHTPVELNSASFLIGNGNPVESNAECIISVELNHQADGSELLRDSETAFRWIMSRSAAGHYRELLSGMSDSAVPCHQYLDPDNTPPAPVVIVSLDEYDADTFRRQNV